jgi:hypothetical protein
MEVKHDEIKETCDVVGAIAHARCMYDRTTHKKGLACNSICISCNTSTHMASDGHCQSLESCRNNFINANDATQGCAIADPDRVWRADRWL